MANDATTTIELPGAGARVRFRTTEKADGDFAVALSAPELAARRAAVVDLPWVWLRQVHGADVVTVTAANAGEVSGTEADALVTREPGVALAIHTADCVPVLLVSANGVLGVAHAGWQGIAVGVLQATLGAMVGLGASVDGMQVVLGPHIGPECYEFGLDLLAQLDEQLAAPTGLPGSVRGTTRGGAPALDLHRAVTAALGNALGAPPGGAEDGVPTTAVPRAPACTACEADRFFSHRARAEAGRMATVAWLEPT